MPLWLKLVRSGSNFTPYVSADGATWTQVGSTQTIPMGSTVYAGFAASSGFGGAYASGFFDSVLITGTTPDFSLTAIAPLVGTPQTGGSTYPKIFVGSLNGFSGTVNLSIGGLPTGATATFSSASVAAPGSALLTITTTSATPPGSYPITVTGTSGNTIRSASLLLIALSG